MIRLLRSLTALSAASLVLSLGLDPASAQVAPTKPPTAEKAAPAPAPGTTPAPSAAPDKDPPKAVAPAQAAPEKAAPVAPAPAAPTGEASPPADAVDPLEEGPLPEAPVDRPMEDPDAASEDINLGERRIIDTSKTVDANPYAEPEPEPEIDPNTLPFTYHMKHVDLALGLRFIGTPDEGLDPFLYEPNMADLYLRAGYALPLAERFALAALLEASTSGAEAHVRDRPTSLSLARFTLGLEGRYHFHHRLYAYGRVAPGVEIGYAEWGEHDDFYPSMRDDNATFVVDGSLGLAMRFAGAQDGRKKGVRFWGFAEGGYRYAGKHDFVLKTEDSVGRIQPITLDPLTTRGGFFSTGLMLTF